MIIIKIMFFCSAVVSLHALAAWRDDSLKDDKEKGRSRFVTEITNVFFLLLICSIAATIINL